MLLFLILLSFIFSTECCDEGWIETYNTSCVKIPESFPPNPSISSPFCSPGWSLSSVVNKCYRIFPIQLPNYSSAEKLCGLFNSSLATILSEDHQAAIYEISNRGWSPEIDPNSGNYAWLGLFKEKRLYWIWQDDTRINPAFWAQDMVDDPEKQCGIYDPTVKAKNQISGGLKQIECEKTKEIIGNVICEQDALSLNYTKLPSNCEHDWYFYEKTGRCYKVFEGSLSLEGRNEECKKHKSKLTDVQIPDEMNFVANLITSGWRLPTRRNNSKNLVWIGSVAENVIPFNESEANQENLCYTLDPQANTIFNGTKYLGEVAIQNCAAKYTHFVCAKENTTTEGISPVGFKRISLIVIVSSIIFFAVSAVVGVLIYRKKRSRKNCKPIFDDFSLFKRSSSAVEAYPLLGVENSLNLADIKFTETMGSGHFGCVFSGEMAFNNVPLKVAVKSRVFSILHADLGCRICGDQEQLKVLSSELTAMSRLPIHPNIVALIGSVTTELKKSGQLYILMELCELKSLHSFLSKFQNSHYVNELEKDTKLNTQYYNITEEEYGYMNSSEERKNFAANELRTTDLLVFSVQIANGLSFLADNHCIHRDIAARNILLTSDFICKISDFGLARFVEPNYYNTQTVRDSDIEALPQRWMAPESLENNTFSFATDVWSFGIVLFELFSLGKQPYFKFTQDELKTSIISGETNDRPEFCHDEVYNLMRKCWNYEATERPSIKECHKVLKEHLEKAFPARSNYLDDVIGKEKVRQRDIKNLCISRTYYNS